eukprot:CAMPEP_0119105428 /NCGR_PEP_ID=MMETSP1180-20130426/3388_1 /TAXON_ID=3052 ORGANISM="Chlamydomonas cf sp, Strain CCMP681" /NCGR_SAMPLE_ID=MMETSP1180 /ASSEMBLY_ACC=CAM_ASM_000741 /LENGTH=318 /DNA_ID=CAMNT_0007090471 /DNA_START=34 /DNA_END=990 /DNA_ORIENTATION=+
MRAASAHIRSAAIKPLLAARFNPLSFLQPRKMQYTATKWWTPETTAVVTGANKGIGYCIAKILVQQGLKVVVAARNEQLGLEAAARIQKETGANPSQVLFHTLDISNSNSIAEFASWAKQNLSGGITILVNNAGTAFKGNVFGPVELRSTLATNYYGTADVTEALLPLITPGTGRVVTVSSRAGSLNILKSESLKQRFLQASTKAELKVLLDEFEALVAKGDDAGMAAAGWPRSMYGVSKLALTQYCRVLSVQQAQVKVHACCPGWCQTDMSSKSGPNTAEDGADTPAFLALQPAEETPTGLMWGERKPVDYVSSVPR